MNTRTSLALPKFQSGQVLRHTDLNNLANYLDQQDRLTRMLLAGIGIVEGLVLDLQVDPANNNPSELTIGTGMGISSDGYTFFLEQDLVLTKYYETTLLKNEIECNPSAGGSTLPAFELLEAGAQADPSVNGTTVIPQVNELKTLPDGQYVGLIFLKDLSEKESRCFNKTDNETTAQRYEAKVYLVKLADYSLCPSGATQQSGTTTPATITGFSQPYIARFGYREASRAGSTVKIIDLNQIQSFSNFNQNYQDICSNAFEIIQNAYVRAYATYHSILGQPPTNEFTDLKTRLEALLTRFNAAQTNTGRLYIQYLYDYLRDLIAAHNEFIDSATDLRQGGQILPNTCAHPRHLSLGKIVVDRANATFSEPGACRSQFLSSAFHEENTGKSRKALFFLERMRKLAMMTPADIDTPNPFVHLPIPTNLSGLRITPSLANISPLSARAIPFYYDGGIRDNWNFYLRETGRLDTILGYHFRNSSPPYDEPLLYELDRYSFFRIEGLIGTPVSDAYQALRQKQQDLDAPFDIQFVKLGTQLSGLGSQELMPGDLQPVYEALSLDIWCMLEALTPPPSTRLKAQIFPASLVDFRFVNFESRYKTYANAPSTGFGQIDCHKPLLRSLENEYQLRRQSFHLFHLFSDQHPGLEHLAGVPKGGTLVVVYADESNGTGPVVVGDFSLPYTCCADRGGVVFPETYVAAPPGYFCQNDQKTYELITYPLGGILEWGVDAITLNAPDNNYISADSSGKYYFNPNLLLPDVFTNGQAVINLVYSKYQKRSEGSITVYQTPAFDIRVQGSPVKRYDANRKLISQLVLFEAINIQPQNVAMNWKWMVGGEPTPVYTRPTGFQFEFPYSEGLVYSVKLIAENGICRTERELEFKLCEEIVSLELLSDSEFPQGSTDPIRVNVSPADGQFLLIAPDQHVIRPIASLETGQTDVYQIPAEELKILGVYKLIYKLQQCLQEESTEITITARPPDPIEIDRDRFCSDDDTNYPIHLNPTGGTFSSNMPGIVEQNGQYYFNPSLVNAQAFNNKGQAEIRLEYTASNGASPFGRVLSVTQMPEVEVISKLPIYKKGVFPRSEQPVCLLKGYTVHLRVRPNLWTSYNWEVLETGQTQNDLDIPDTSFEFLFLQGNEFHIKVVGVNSNLPISAGCPPEHVEVVQILCPVVSIGFDLVRAAQDKVLQILRPSDLNFVANVPAFLFSKEDPNSTTGIPEFKVWIKVNHPGGTIQIERFDLATNTFVDAPQSFAVEAAENELCDEKKITYWLSLNLIDLTADKYRLLYWIDDCSENIIDTTEFILVEFPTPEVANPVAVIGSAATVQPADSRSSRPALPDILDKRLKDHREVIKALEEDNSLSRSNAFKFTKILMDTGRDLPVLNDNFEQAFDAAAVKVRDAKDHLKSNYELLLDTIILYYLDRIVAFSPLELPASTAELIQQKGADFKDVLNFKQVARNWQGEQLTETLGTAAIEAVLELLKNQA